MKYAVGMSGGVDSTVAASILLEQGHEVIGLTMQIWDGSVKLSDTLRASCYGPDEAEELEAVRALATRIGIPHHTIPLAAEYKEHVLDYFRREYLAGRTPNPCVRCNHTMKFGFMLSAARASGIAFDAFATGHYARVSYNEQTGRYQLSRAKNTAKDQSYFLANLTPEQLAIVHFPLGDWSKSDVRDKARALGFEETANQPESQDFIGCADFSPLFEGLPVHPGPILDRHGSVLGQHRGIIHYTIGQRKGLGLSGSAEPLYVVAIDAEKNALVVGRESELLSGGLIANQVNWISIAPPREPLDAEVRIRQQHQPAPATLTPPANNTGSVSITFKTPQKSVTPGQAVVFYHGDTVLGGGWIDQALALKE